MFPRIVLMMVRSVFSER